MRIIRFFASLVVLLGLCPLAQADGAAHLSARQGMFVLEQPEQKPLTSHDLVGAVFEMRTDTGLTLQLRIDGVTQAKESRAILLHRFSVQTAGGTWVPYCDPDPYQRRAGFPVAGAWHGGRFVADPKQWFITCTSGSQGKCILWGYDPWNRGPHGENLVPYYEACQHMTRADYDGRGTAHTKNGTLIVLYDHIGIQADDVKLGAVFEAGWKPDGAVCVAHTRWGDLLNYGALMRAAPRLGGHCDEKSATARGAILFNRSKIAGAGMPSRERPSHAAAALVR